MDVRITGLHISHFGVWHGLDVSELPDGVTVVYGPNEAGKTTLLHFIRTMLYGFTPERCERYLHSLPENGNGHVTRFGGQLNVTSSEGDYQIRRFTDSSTPFDSLGKLRLLADDGSRLDPQQLESMLADVDESTFNNVFAVGLSELQYLATLNDSHAAQLLYNLSTGVDGAVLRNAITELDNAGHRLLGGSGGDGQIVQLLSERKTRRAELKSITVDSNDWPSLQLTGETLAHDIDQLEKDRRELEQKCRALEIARRVQPAWRERRQIIEQLESLETPSDLPSGTLQQLRKLKKKISRRRQRLERLKQEKQDCREKTNQLTWNEELSRHDARITTLSEQSGWIQALDDQVHQLSTEVEELEFEVQARQEQLGISDGESNTQLVLAVKGARTQLQEPAAEMKQHQGTLDRTRREVARCENNLSLCEQQIKVQLERLMGTRSDGAESNVVVAIEQTALLASNLRRRIELGEAIKEQREQLREVNRKRSRMMQNQILPPRVLISIGGAFVLGVVLLLTGFFWRAFALSQATSSPLMLIGAVASALALLIYKLLENSSDDQLDAIEQQHDLLRNQRKGAQNEWNRLDQQIPESDSSLSDQLRTAERELADLQALLPLDKDRQQAEQELTLAVQAADQAAAVLTAVSDRWQAALRTAGLPDRLSPDILEHSMGRSGTLNELRDRLRDAKGQLDQRRRERSAVQRRIQETLDDLDIVPDSDRASDQLRQLIEARQAQADVAAKSQVYRQQLQRIRQEHQEMIRQIQHLQRKRRSIVNAAGADDERQLRQIEERIHHSAELEQKRDELTNTIESELDGQVPADLVRSVLEEDATADLSNCLGATRSEVNEVESRIAKLHQQSGELTQRLRSIGSDRQVQIQRIELARVNCELDHRLGDARVLGITSQLLSAVFRKYERERQPETLKQASIYLQRLTEGRYIRIWAPLGNHELRVDESTDQTIPVERLSRGTREQVFLSLRLALVAVYASRGVRLPMILDDVLVNFDTDRAHRAAEVFKDFAAGGHQLLLFTCHDHIRQIFQQIGLEVRELPSRGSSPSPATAAKPVPRLQGVTADGLASQSETDTLAIHTLETDEEKVRVRNTGNRRRNTFDYTNATSDKISFGARSEHGRQDDGTMAPSIFGDEMTDEMTSGMNGKSDPRVEYVYYVDGEYTEDDNIDDTSQHLVSLAANDDR